MTRAYVLDPVTRATLGLVDQSWERLAYTRRYFGMDTFELSINRTRLWASELSTNRLLYLPDEGDLVFLIEQITSVAEGSTRNDQMTVTGRSLEGIAMAERLVEPPVGDSHDRQTGVAAETAMKHYLRGHAADLAAPARTVPGLVVAPDAARGTTVTAAGRFQSVLDLVREIGLLAGIGWEITYDPATGDSVFDVVVGADRTASVFFDFAFETLERWEELDSVIDAKTVAVVAGQGEGAAREVATRWSGAEPTGFDRREAFLDARDVELGATTILEQRGDAFLAATGAETSLEADVHQYGAFRYRQHWDVGDVVLVRNAERGLSYVARVVEVEKAFERSAAAPTITATLGRPFPSLQSQSSSARASTADNGGATITGLVAGGVLAGTYPDPAFAVDMATQGELDAVAAGVPSGGSAGPDADAMIDSAGAAGTGGTFARSGHGHRVVTTDAPSGATITLDAAPSAGSTGAIARATHGHRLNTYSSVPGRRATSGSAGSSATAPSRGDHVHPWTAPIRRVYTSATTWSKPANLAWIEVECVGGGGGGGGAGQPTSSTQSAAAAGGGGGGYARKLVLASALPASCSVAVGAAGSGASAGNNAGGSGAASTFSGSGITTVSGGGGSGGAGMAPSGGVAHSAGGAGGTASGGDINCTGSDGGNGNVVQDSNGSVSQIGTGGASGGGFGGATAARASSGDGTAGSQFGGGGSGGFNANSQSTNRSGGAGAAGVVIVTEYYL